MAKLPFSLKHLVADGWPSEVLVVFALANTTVQSRRVISLKPPLCLLSDIVHRHVVVGARGMASDVGVWHNSVVTRDRPDRKCLLACVWLAFCATQWFIVYTSLAVLRLLSKPMVMPTPEHNAREKIVKGDNEGAISFCNHGSYE